MPNWPSCKDGKICAGRSDFRRVTWVHTWRVNRAQYNHSRRFSHGHSLSHSVRMVDQAFIFHALVHDGKTKGDLNEISPYCISAHWPFRARGFCACKGHHHVPSCGGRMRRRQCGVSQHLWLFVQGRWPHKLKMRLYSRDGFKPIWRKHDRHLGPL